MTANTMYVLNRPYTSDLLGVKITILIRGNSKFRILANWKSTIASPGLVFPGITGASLLRLFCVTLDMYYIIR